MPNANPNFDDIASSTLINYRPQLTENILGHQVLFAMMKEKGYVIELDGGSSIVEPVLLNKNLTVSSYDGYDLINVDPQKTVDAAQFAWKQVAGSVVISGKEEFQNSGSKTQIISLLDSKIQQLEMSMMMQFDAYAYGDGTGNSGKDFAGLGLLVQDGSAWSVVGGIDSNVFSGWRNQYISSVGSFAANGQTKMRTMFNNCSIGNDKPTLISTDQTTHESYEKTLTSNLQIVDLSIGDSGFRVLEYKGVPVIFDENNPSGHMIFLNDKYLRLVFGKGKNFVMSSFVKPENQDAKVAQMFVYGNWTIRCRNRMGRLTGITNP